jgi:hypothetical protein
MKNILEKLKRHMLVVNHTDNSFQIMKRLQNLKKNHELPQLYESKEIEFSDEKCDEDQCIIDVAESETKCQMLAGSLLHREKYLKTMKITWSLPKLYQNASNSLQSEVIQN